MTNKSLYLYEATLDLTDVNGGVETLADVHDDVGAEDLVVPGQTVDLHHTAGTAIGEVVEKRPLLRVSVVADVRDSATQW